jgi:hypothetical protein
MLNLTLGETTYIYLTLRESITLTSPNYLMRFVQRTTNDEAAFVLRSSDDVSPYPERYQKFLVDVDQRFCGQIGEYQYYIYEQASQSNLDPDLAGGLLEQGLARLNPAADDVYAFTAYQTANIYTTK